MYFRTFEFMFFSLCFSRLIETICVNNYTLVLKIVQRRTLESCMQYEKLEIPKKTSTVSLAILLVSCV